MIRRPSGSPSAATMRMEGMLVTLYEPFDGFDQDTLIVLLSPSAGAGGGFSSHRARPPLAPGWRKVCRCRRPQDHRRRFVPIRSTQVSIVLARTAPSVPIMSPFHKGDSGLSRISFSTPYE